MSDQTIYARASAPGRAGVAVFRISGSQAIPTAQLMCDGHFEPRKAALVEVKDQRGDRIDRGLVLCFPGPQSFTGEDVVELHLHGSRAVELHLYETLSDHGLKLAEPGEFTLRAMKNGKMDLAQVEALSDHIDSETIQQKMQALHVLEGALSERVEHWRSLLLNIYSPLTAQIDFPDEGDIPVAIAEGARVPMEQLCAELAQAKSSAKSAQHIREGFSIVLSGAPNVGKSSLLNALAGSEIAIVSDQPGTTRDIIEARLDIEGMLAVFRDTAGLRDETKDTIELEGIRRSKEASRTADLTLHVVTEKEVLENVSRGTSSLTDGFTAGTDILVINKVDTLSIDEAAFTRDQGLPVDPVYVSALHGTGMAHLISTIAARLKQMAPQGETGLLTRQRHIDAVSMAMQALERADEMLSQSPELAAEDLRLAQRAFDQLVGAVDVEDILGEIFSRFCVGK